MTNLPKLNVIIWLIKIGFYDYLIEESWNYIVVYIN
jgi:hypothetical protein